MDDAIAVRCIEALAGELERQKRLADAAVAQVDDAGFFAAPDADSNSIAVLMKHVAGNMRSRWTDFLETDGERPDRDRDGEFEIRAGETREAIVAAWEDAWRRAFGTLRALEPADLGRTVTLYGEPLTVPRAATRQLAHTAHHVGQIVYLAKQLRSADWRTLSIPRGHSREHAAALFDKHAAAHSDKHAPPRA